MPVNLDNLRNYCVVVPIDTQESSFDKTFISLLPVENKESIPLLQKDFQDSHIFKYFTNYLNNEPNGLGVGTIVSELQYTCLNFLEDFVNYYARCYTPYEKNCKRLHFFSCRFAEDIFKEMVFNPNHGNWASYQGCMVVKPIPKGVIGVTYLNHYDSACNGGGSAEKRRHYKCLTRHSINLFGKELDVETMPFKEQDGVVASCATTAMWMAFHKTAEIFHTKAPSLSEITILAGDNENNPGKIFPSRGLRVSQVCKAIYSLGMVPELKTEFESLSYFKGYVHAYLKCGIPVLFGFTFKNETQDENHLITLNGYRYYNLGDEQSYHRMIADDIEKFYAHDDQIGPFARIVVEENNNPEVEARGNDTRYANNHLDVITAWWKDPETATRSMTANGDFKRNHSNFLHGRPDYLIVPLSSTIKVTYDDIADRFHLIHFMASFYLRLSSDTATLDISWDIFLMKNNDYKQWLHDHFSGFGAHNPLENVEVMMLSLPKYIWVIQAFFKNTLLFDFLFDTVESNIYGLPICVNVYHKAVEAVITHWRDNGRRDIYDSFSSNPANYNESLLRRLNQEIKVTQKIKNDWKDIIEATDSLVESEQISYEEALKKTLNSLQEIPSDTLAQECSFPVMAKIPKPKNSSPSYKKGESAYRLPYLLL